MSTKWSTDYDGQMRLLYEGVCHCGKTYWVPLNQVRKRKSCSDECGRLGRRNRVTLVCGNPRCGRSFEVTPKRAKASKSGILFCKRSCKDQAQQLDVGVVQIQPPHFTSIDLSPEYRKKALRSLGEVCGRCGYTGVTKMLDVHHKDGDRSNNRMDNLEVICVWCHALETRNVEPCAWTGQFGAMVK